MANANPNTDRELLELAAKAADIPLAWSGNEDQSPRDRGNWDVWNPLEDDGDAVRLARKLGFTLDFSTPDEPEVLYLNISNWPQRANGRDYRRSIVRAAAEIGKYK